MGTTDHDKLERMRALYARWKYEDHEEVVDGAGLQARQRIRVKEIGLIVFGFPLREEQIEAIWTLYSEQRDLLLLAKPGFGKSVIFQLLPFMSPVTGVVIVLMPLNILQTQQRDMIDSLPRGKGVVLNGENNQKPTHISIARGDCTHVFTTPEIALSVNFKRRVLDHPGFTNRLVLLAVDGIHLVDELGKSLRPRYAEIEKVRKRIPQNVPLLGVSSTLTGRVRQRVLQKAGFSTGCR